MPIQLDCALLLAQPKLSINAVMLVSGGPTVVTRDNADRKMDAASGASALGGVATGAAPSDWCRALIVRLRVAVPTRRGASGRRCGPPDVPSDGMGASYSSLCADHSPR